MSTTKTTPTDLLYTRQHEWVRRKSAESIAIGITDHAQDRLGDVVYVELPQVGDMLRAGASFGTVESVKAVSDVYVPVDGEIIAVNDALEKQPELVNQQPYTQGWMIVMRIAADNTLDDLLDAQAYEQHATQDA